MKKNIVLVLFGLLALQCTSADEVTQDVGRLPEQAQEFIRKYFPAEKISYITIDEELLSTDYEVKFVSGTELEFVKDGEWKNVDCKRQAVPAGIVPAPIADYASRNFAEVFITQIEKDGKRYDVELSNGLDLQFDKHFNFVGADD